MARHPGKAEEVAILNIEEKHFPLKRITGTQNQLMTQSIDSSVVQSHSE